MCVIVHEHDCVCTLIEKEKVGNGKCIFNFFFFFFFLNCILHKGMNYNSWMLMLLTSSCLVLD